MFKHEHEEVTITCEMVASNVEDSPVAEEEEVEFASRYLVKIENSEAGSDYEIIIDMEGNPGVCNAVHTVLEHLKTCKCCPLDMLARVNLYHTPSVLQRLDEISDCIIIASETGLGNIKQILRKIPEWDLDYGCYRIIQIEDVMAEE